MAAFPRSLASWALLTLGLLLSITAPAQQWDWATMPAMESATIENTLLAVDAAGNRYVAGTFQGTFHLGATQLTSAGDKDVFVAKRSTSGAWLWAVRAGGTGTDYCAGLALDAGGNPSLTGYFHHGPAQFGATTLPGSPYSKDVFVARLTSSGSWAWAVAVSAPDDEAATTIAVDATGDAYVAGYFRSDTLRFGSHILLNSAQSAWGIVIYNGFVAKISAAGSWQWASAATGRSSVWPSSIAVDQNGRAYVASRFYGGTAEYATFGQTTLYGQGDDMCIVARIGATGTWDWATSTYSNPCNGQRGESQADAVAVDPAGNAYLAGRFRYYAHFDTITLSATAAPIGMGQYIAKLSPAGIWQWARPIMGVSITPVQLARDAGNNLYLTGTISTPTQIGTTTLTPTVSPFSGRTGDAYVAKLSPMGSWLWATKAGPGDKYSDALAVAPNGDIYTTGRFFAPTTVGSTSLTATGNYSFFLGRVTPTGTWQNAITGGGTSGHAGGRGIGRDAAGNLYVTGYFNGTIQLGATQLTSAGKKDVYVGKLSPTGQCLWATRAGGPDDEEGASVGIDAGGNLFVAGTYQGTGTTFGSQALPAASGVDMFVARLSAAGTWQWARRAGGGGPDHVSRLLLDTHGQALLTGSCMGHRPTFGPYTLTGDSTNSSLFVAKISPAGVWRWATTATGGGPDEALALTTDPAGHVYVGGTLGGSHTTFGALPVVDVRPSPIHSFGTGFIARLDSSGQWQWARALTASPGHTAVEGLAVAHGGDLYVTGSFGCDSLAFGATLLLNQSAIWLNVNGYPLYWMTHGTSRIFVARLGASGAWQWGIQAPSRTSYLYNGYGDAIAGNNPNYPQLITTDSHDRACIAGQLASDSTAFGSLLVTTPGPFVAAVSSTGQWEDVQAARSSWAQRPWYLALTPPRLDMVLTAPGKVALTGEFDIEATFGPAALRTEYGSGAYVAAVQLASPLGTSLADAPAAADGLLVWPNPAHDELRVQLPAGCTATAATLLDALGRVVRSSQFEVSSSNLDLRGLPAGLYLLRVTTPTGALTRRVLVQN